MLARGALNSFLESFASSLESAPSATARMENGFPFFTCLRTSQTFIHIVPESPGINHYIHRRKCRHKGPPITCDPLPPQIKNTSMRGMRWNGYSRWHWNLQYQQRSGNQRSYQFPTGRCQWFLEGWQRWLRFSASKTWLLFCGCRFRRITSASTCTFIGFQHFVQLGFTVIFFH